MRLTRYAAAASALSATAALTLGLAGPAGAQSVGSIIVGSGIIGSQVIDSGSSQINSRLSPEAMRVNPIPGLNGVIGLPNLTGKARPVAQSTGMMSANYNPGDNVLGTDLGVMWDNGHGEVLTAFGDTAGLGLMNLLIGSTWSWRSNIIYRSTDGNLADGMTFTSAPRDGQGVKELIPSAKVPGNEISKIPTAGIAIGDTQVMSVMSVRQWDSPGQWSTNWSQLAVSHDNGENWSLLPETTRLPNSGDEKFQMSAFLKADGYLYQYATQSGRGGSVSLARVPEAQFADLGAYEYWNGNPGNHGGWTRGNPGAAASMAGPSGELSVLYNEFSKQYIMMTTDTVNNIVIRRSPTPVGPWTPDETVVSAGEFPTGYGAFMHPWSQGPDIYFMTTQHTNYNTILMRTPAIG